MRNFSKLRRWGSRCSLGPRGVDTSSCSGLLYLIVLPVLSMSKQHSFTIKSFRFGAFVPKEIEYILFWNKIMDQNKHFLSVLDKFEPKSFVLVHFQIFLRQLIVFLYLKNHSTICNVLVLFWYHFLKIKTIQTGKKNLEIVCKKFRFVCSEA